MYIAKPQGSFKLTLVDNNGLIKSEFTEDNVITTYGDALGYNGHGFKYYHGMCIGLKKHKDGVQSILYAADDTTRVNASAELVNEVTGFSESTPLTLTLQYRFDPPAQDRNIHTVYLVNDLSGGTTVKAYVALSSYCTQTVTDTLFITYTVSIDNSDKALPGIHTTNFFTVNNYLLSKGIIGQYYYGYTTSTHPYYDPSDTHFPRFVAYSGNKVPSTSYAYNYLSTDGANYLGLSSSNAFGKRYYSKAFSREEHVGSIIKSLSYFRNSIPSPYTSSTLGVSAVSNLFDDTFTHKPVQTTHAHTEYATHPFMDVTQSSIGYGSVNVTNVSWDKENNEILRTHIVKDGNVADNSARFTLSINETTGYDTSFNPRALKSIFLPDMESTHAHHVPTISGDVHGLYNSTNMEDYNDGKSIISWDSNGLIILNLYSGAYKKFDATSSPSLVTTNLRKVVADFSGNIWCATADAGLIKISTPFGTPSISTLITGDVDITDTACHSLSLGKDDTIWAVFDGGFVKVNNVGNVTTFTGIDIAALWNITSWNKIRNIEAIKTSSNGKLGILFEGATSANYELYLGWWGEVDTPNNYTANADFDHNLAIGVHCYTGKFRTALNSREEFCILDNNACKIYLWGDTVNQGTTQAIYTYPRINFIYSGDPKDILTNTLIPWSNYNYALYLANIFTRDVETWVNCNYNVFYFMFEKENTGVFLGRRSSGESYNTFANSGNFYLSNLYIQTTTNNSYYPFRYVDNNFSTGSVFDYLNIKRYGHNGSAWIKHYNKDLLDTVTGTVIANRSHFYPSDTKFRFKSIITSTIKDTGSVESYDGATILVSAKYENIANSTSWTNLNSIYRHSGHEAFYIYKLYTYHDLELKSFYTKYMMPNFFGNGIVFGEDSKYGHMEVISRTVTSGQRIAQVFRKTQSIADTTDWTRSDKFFRYTDNGDSVYNSNYPNNPGRYDLDTNTFTFTGNYASYISSNRIPFLVNSTNSIDTRFTRTGTEHLALSYTFGNILKYSYNDITHQVYEYPVDGYYISIESYTNTVSTPKIWIYSYTNNVSTTLVNNVAFTKNSDFTIGYINGTNDNIVRITDNLDDTLTISLIEIVDTIQEVKYTYTTPVLNGIIKDSMTFRVGASLDNVNDTISVKDLRIVDSNDSALVYTPSVDKYVMDTYINGTKESTIYLTHLDVTEFKPHFVTLGGYTDYNYLDSENPFKGVNGGFVGEIYNFQIWEGALTEAELGADYTTVGLDTYTSVTSPSVNGSIKYHLKNSFDQVSSESLPVSTTPIVFNGVNVSFTESTEVGFDFIKGDYFTTGLVDGVFKDNSISFDIYNEIVIKKSEVLTQMHEPIAGVNNTSIVLPATAITSTSVPGSSTGTNQDAYSILSEGKLFFKNVLVANNDFEVKFTPARSQGSAHLRNALTSHTYYYGFDFNWSNDQCTYQVNNNGTLGNSGNFDVVSNVCSIVRTGTTVEFKINDSTIQTETIDSSSNFYLYATNELYGVYFNSVISVPCLLIGSSVANSGVFNEGFIGITDSLNNEVTIDGNPAIISYVSYGSYYNDITVNPGEVKIFLKEGMLLFNAAEIGSTITANLVCVYRK